MNKTAQYLSELYRWNRKINLTSVKEHEAQEVLVKPSLAMLEFMPAQKGLEVFDIGSGGGLPAIILAIHLPDIRFTLVESDRKKSVFLTHIAGLLGLKNVRVVCERSEKLAKMEGYAGCADVVTSRAVKREDVFAASNGLLKPGGIVIIHHSPREIEDDPRFIFSGKNQSVDCYRRFVV